MKCSKLIYVQYISIKFFKPIISKWLQFLVKKKPGYGKQILPVHRVCYNWVWLYVILLTLEYLFSITWKCLIAKYLHLGKTTKQDYLACDAYLLWQPYHA